MSEDSKPNYSPMPPFGSIMPLSSKEQEDMDTIIGGYFEVSRAIASSLFIQRPDGNYRDS
jgi:hypothetical protein